MLVVWAEMDVMLADEFRDGNVPAMMAPLAVAKGAFAALPETVATFYSIIGAIRPATNAN